MRLSGRVYVCQGYAASIIWQAPYYAGTFFKALGKLQNSCIRPVMNQVALNPLRDAD